MYTKTQLEAMSGSQLVSLYNEQRVKLKDPIPPVNKFSDKETAVRRVQNLLNDIKEQQPAPKSVAQVEEKKERGVRRKYFNFAPNKEIKPYVPDMKQLRGRLFVELKKGMTFERAMEIVREFDADRGVPSKNVERRAYEGTRLVHYYLGYGLRQDENLVIWLVEKK